MKPKWDLLLAAFTMYVCVPVAWEGDPIAGLISLIAFVWSVRKLLLLRRARKAAAS